MFQVYFWDAYIGQFRVHAEFSHRGAAEVVACRMSATSGSAYLVRFHAA